MSEPEGAEPLETEPLYGSDEPDEKSFLGLDTEPEYRTPAEPSEREER